MQIYAASSWKNRYQPGIVEILRKHGHDVYDFRHPEPGNDGFSWSQIDPHWREWTPEQYREALQHPIAEAGYKLDIGAVRRCEIGLLILPAGRSASWELGYIMGQGKPGVIYIPEPCEPDLMYREAEILVSEREIRERFRQISPLPLD